MATTLTYVATSVELPEALSWPDEYSWTPLEERREYSITGALIIETGTRLAGRPITLRGSADRGWVQRSVLDQLLAWAQLPTATFTLLLRGTTHTVKMDHVAGAIQAEPVFDEALPEAGDYCVVTLRFIKI